MSRYERLQFPEPPSDIRIWRSAATVNLSEQLSTAERAGYQRGVIDGEKALSQQLLRQRADFLELYNGALLTLQQAVPQVVQQTEETLIALALEIAQKLVVGVPFTRDTVAASVREALTQVENAAELHILLHPEDLALIQTDSERLFDSETAVRTLRFTPSSEISRGGCLVQTRFGSIDTRRETKLAHVAEALGVL